MQRELLELTRHVAGKLVLFVDTCHAGNALGRGTRDITPKIDLKRLASELSDAKAGAIVYAASTGDQLAQEAAEWANGAFTKALVTGIRNGGADNRREGYVTVAGLEDWLDRKVRELTDGEQTPTVGKNATPNLHLFAVP